MKLLEYEAKRILAASDLPVPKSYMANEMPEFLPAVIKSQVPTGGRGKAGGIVVVKTSDEYESALSAVKQLFIKGFIPKTLLAEELIDIDRELYLSLLIDKKLASIVLMAHTNGGVEVEENPQDSYFVRPLSATSDFDAVGEALAEYYDLPDQTFALQDLVEKLYGLFTANDALLIEINPLIVTRKGKLVAGDCKMECDDAARFRHPEWQFEAEKTEANFVTLDPAGNVATIANGAGLAMATVDAASDAGLTPANFLDIGGGANEASVLAAFERLVEFPQVRVIVINIFAGITRCDEVAKAILAARERIATLPPLTIRLAGTNYEQAAELLSDAHVPIYASLDEALTAAQQEVK